MSIEKKKLEIELKKSRINELLNHLRFKPTKPQYEEFSEEEIKSNIIEVIELGGPISPYELEIVCEQVYLQEPKHTRIVMRKLLDVCDLIVNNDLKMEILKWPPTY